MTAAAPDARRLAALDSVSADLEPPFAVLDLVAWRANAADLVRRAAGKPIRVASKSVRSRALLADVLARPGFAGVLAFTLAEGLWLAGAKDRSGEARVTCEDVVVGYPSADRTAIRRLLEDPALAGRVTIMVDDVAQLDLVDAVRAGAGGPDTTVRVCIDLDASLRLAGGRLHLGVRRSPVHDPEQAAALARAIAGRAGFALVGLMAYEAQVAGLQDDAARSLRSRLRQQGVRRVQALSLKDIQERRAAVVAAVRAVAELEFVNGGGTGSVHSTTTEPAVTEIAAGSGLLAPTTFDGYRAFSPRPAAFFALPVVRRPGPGIATVMGGGWIASGPSGPDRSPVPVWPPGLQLIGTEGAGEVQTPLTGRAADALAVGDRVWFRHAKAGELGEHVDALHLVDDAPGGPELTGPALTYRGEGYAFV